MRHALAVDLGGTELRAAMVAETGAIVAVATCDTDSRGGPEAVLTQMVHLLAKVRHQSSDAVPVGLGIAAPGPLDAEAGIAIAPPTLAGWRDVPLAAQARDRIGLPVRIENDANAAALGEWGFGAGRGTRHMVFVTVSTGIGGGVIIDGKLLQGRRGLAAEVGHMTVCAASTEALFGGAPGAWEALASGTALTREAARRAVGAQGRCLRALAGGGPVTAKHVVEAAREQDPLACDLLAEEARWLGIGFVNLLHLYSPERIVVGGGVSAGLDLMQAGILRTIRERAMSAYRDVPIAPAALGSHAGLVGAASLVL